MDVKQSATTVFLVFVGLLVFAAFFLWVTVLDKPVKNKLSAQAVEAYGEDISLVIDLVAKEMVPRFPHLEIDALVPLVVAATKNKTKAKVELYEQVVRQAIMRHRGDPDAAKTSVEGGITHWSD